jgi:hypothetical protein
MAGDDAIGIVDQDRVGEAEYPDAVGDLADLLIRMGPRIARIGFQAGDGTGFDVQRRHRKPPIG